MADPWMKFYASDWRSDPRLKMCSAGARGVWIEMICLMHEANPYGHLLVYGQPPNEAQLASLTGIPVAELSDYLAELERMGVCSRTKEGVIYSRKLVRMAAKSAKARKNGKKGGNPSLSKESENQQSLNLQYNGGDKPQKPEARNQSKKEEPNGSSKKKRRTSIPEDAAISDRMLEIAQEQGVPPDQARAQFDLFKGGAIANGRTYADWDAAWRNWLKSPYFKPVLVGGQHGQSPSTASQTRGQHGGGYGQRTSIASVIAQDRASGRG